MVSVWPGQDGVGGLGDTGGDGCCEEDVGVDRSCAVLCRSVLCGRREGRSVVRSFVADVGEVGWLESGVDVGCRRVVVS